MSYLVLLIIDKYATLYLKRKSEFKSYSSYSTSEHLKRPLRGT